MNVGDVAIITATFRQKGVLRTPDALAIVVRPPSSARYVIAYPSDAVEVVSDGVLQVSVPCTEPSTPAYNWRVQFVSTGEISAGVQTTEYPAFGELL